MTQDGYRMRPTIDIVTGLDQPPYGRLDAHHLEIIPRDDMHAATNRLIVVRDAGTEAASSGEAGE